MCGIAVERRYLIYHIPVFNHLHRDPQFGFLHEHYHIDGRFEIHPRMRHWFKIDKGYTLTVIVTHDEASYYFQGITYRSLKCERQDTGLAFSENPTEKQQKNLKNYHEWYQGFIGKSCKGRRCPHYGTIMFEKNGLLVCPMHHLTADPLSLLVIPES
jgi:hypothetical protein